jgi:hypothetical protein
LKIINFQWDSANVEHIARHRVKPFEVEEVLEDDPLLRRTHDGRYLAYGRTEVGRCLLVIFVWKSEHAARVIAARDLTTAEKKRLKKRRK